MTTAASVSTIGLPAQTDTSPIKLWSTRRIAFLSFLLGFPGGTVLLAMNLRRMRMMDRALVPILVAAISTVLAPTLATLFPDLPGWLFTSLGLLLDGYVIYLAQMHLKEFQSATPNREIQYRGWLSGIGIALASLAIYLVITIPIYVTLVYFGTLYGVIK